MEIVSISPKRILYSVHFDLTATQSFIVFTIHNLSRKINLDDVHTKSWSALSAYIQSLEASWACKSSKKFQIIHLNVNKILILICFDAALFTYYNKYLFNDLLQNFLHLLKKNLQITNVCTYKSEIFCQCVRSLTKQSSYKIFGVNVK